MTFANRGFIIDLNLIKDVVIINKNNNIISINEELNIIKYEKDKINILIYTIRGKQVVLDKDIAKLYGVETRIVNQAVKRNIDRFPENFCFQLNDIEFNALRSQIVISKGGRRYLPYAFTEQGVAMLSAVLHSQKAIEVSINIMNAFIEMRNFLSQNSQILNRLSILEYKQIENEMNFDKIFNIMQKEDNIKQKVFFQGQIFDSYSLIIDIIRKANKKILIIDNYIDDSILKMLTKKRNHVETIILTSDKSNISNLDIQKFNKEYPILKVAKTNKFHDRFIVIDNSKLYHLRCFYKRFR